MTVAEIAQFHELLHQNSNAIKRADCWTCIVFAELEHLREHLSESQQKTYRLEEDNRELRKEIHDLRNTVQELRLEREAAALAQ